MQILEFTRSYINNIKELLLFGTKNNRITLNLIFFTLRFVLPAL